MYNFINQITTKIYNEIEESLEEILNMYGIQTRNSYGIKDINSIKYQLEESGLDVVTAFDGVKHYIKVNDMVFTEIEFIPEKLGLKVTKYYQKHIDK